MTALWFFLAALILAGVGDYITHPPRPIGRHSAAHFAAEATTDTLPDLMEAPDALAA